MAGPLTSRRDVCGGAARRSASAGAAHFHPVRDGVGTSVRLRSVTGDAPAGMASSTGPPCRFGGVDAHVASGTLTVRCCRGVDVDVERRVVWPRRCQRRQRSGGDGGVTWSAGRDVRSAGRWRHFHPVHIRSVGRCRSGVLPSIAHGDHVTRRHRWQRHQHAPLRWWRWPSAASQERGTVGAAGGYRVDVDDGVVTGRGVASGVSVSVVVMVAVTATSPP